MMDRLKTVKVTLEAMMDRAERPLYNELDTGFRHSPLTIQEQLTRFKQFSDEVRVDCLRSLKFILQGPINLNGIMIEVFDFHNALFR